VRTGGHPQANRARCPCASPPAHHSSCGLPGQGHMTSMSLVHPLSGGPGPPTTSRPPARASCAGGPPAHSCSRPPILCAGRRTATSRMRGSARSSGSMSLAARAEPNRRFGPVASRARGHWPGTRQEREERAHPGLTERRRRLRRAGPAGPETEKWSYGEIPLLAVASRSPVGTLHRSTTIL
jgi:hypothetical protein